MADFDNDAATLDVYEDSVQQEPQPPVNNAEPQPPGSGESNNDNDIITSLLAASGINDSSKIKFENDDGSLSERNWNDLTKEEKLGILSLGNNANDVTDSFSQEELDLINTIRSSQQTPNAYLESLQQAAAAAVSTNNYEIDGIADDELFVLDALDRYGEENVSDEQLETLLANAKSDPALYAKTIEALRSQYKQREDDLKFQSQQQEKAQQEGEYNQFSENILREIESLNTIAGQNIELSPDDMNALANYILTRDSEGNSEFGRDMNDPKKFTQLALWALKGNDIMDEISSQLKKAYEKGVEAGKRGQSQLAFGNPKDKSAPQNTGQFANTLDVS